MGERSRASRFGVAAAAFTVSIATGCGATVPGTPIAEPNSAPFYAAVLDLMTQPVASVRSAKTDGINWNLDITSDGWSVGQKVANIDYTDVLQTGAASYAKPPRELLAANLPRGKSVDSLYGKWITGTDAFLGGVPVGLKPDEVGGALLAELDQVRDFPRVGEPTKQVDADEAYEVVTPRGTLAVSSIEPHRVLRFTPSDDYQPQTTESYESGEMVPRFDPLATPLVFGAMTPDKRQQTYLALARLAGQLNNSVDLSVQFDFKSSGDMKCTNDSCVVSSTATTTTTSNSDKARFSGGVDALMIASITVDGTPSAGCTAAQKIPINGGATLTCTDGSIAPLVAAIRARKQAEADAQSRAQGRSVSVEYVINYKGSVDFQVVPMIQAEVDVLVNQVRGQGDKANSAVSCGPNCTYQLVPYGGDKLSQAANRERQNEGTAPNGNILVALVPGWNDPQTGDLVVGSGGSESGNATAASESDLLGQLSAKGFNPSQITAMYSERQPCFTTCGSKLQGVKPDTPVSYSVPWKENKPEVSAAADSLVVSLSRSAGEK
ncbi:nucleic acid/nucleotide deaminase domain-containing protein [Nocardia sp. NPDC005978]|uniref:nucleic acid/nucleotide deaminase domain-containing protein n=1 Tax=Nocardia sp. NPDC005978 TaxID=3156725 RepID=UPI0033B7F835